MIILVIDDDADDYEMFYETLMSIDKSAKCMHASNGEEALNLLENILTVLPDFIFLDVNMPIMGGKECLGNLKGSEALKDIPVVMYSTTANLRALVESALFPIRVCVGREMRIEMVNLES